MRLLTCMFVMVVPSLSYSIAASSSLQQLATTIDQATNWINHLEGCGFKSTTQAISAGTPLTQGSSCPDADNAIASNLTTVSSAIQQVITQLKSSRSSTEVNSTRTVSDFNAFATAFYALFNAMDLAECTYKLTTSSKTFGAEFSNGGSSNNLKDGYNSVVGELSNDPSIALQIAGTNFKQQTHFGGTSFLATQVGGPKALALAGCTLITNIVQSEGGGSS